MLKYTVNGHMTALKPPKKVIVQNVIASVKGVDIIQCLKFTFLDSENWATLWLHFNSNTVYFET